MLKLSFVSIFLLTSMIACNPATQGVNGGTGNNNNSATPLTKETAAARIAEMQQAISDALSHGKAKMSASATLPDTAFTGTISRDCDQGGKVNLDVSASSGGGAGNVAYKVKLEQCKTKKGTSFDGDLTFTVDASGSVSGEEGEVAFAMKATMKGSAHYENANESGDLNFDVTVALDAKAGTCTVNGTIDAGAGSWTLSNENCTNAAN